MEIFKHTWSDQCCNMNAQSLFWSANSLAVKKQLKQLRHFYREVGPKSDKNWKLKQEMNIVG